MFCVVTFLTGCVSKSTAEAQARAAFLAGQRQEREILEAKLAGSVVTVVGSVKNSLIPWTEDLTLAKALVAAQYVGRMDPTEITVVHQGLGKQYDPKKLLEGEDVPLAPSDIVQIK